MSSLHIKSVDSHKSIMKHKFGGLAASSAWSNSILEFLFYAELLCGKSHQSRLKFIIQRGKHHHATSALVSITKFQCPTILQILYVQTWFADLPPDLPMNCKTKSLLEQPWYGMKGEYMKHGDQSRKRHGL